MQTRIALLLGAEARLLVDAGDLRVSTAHDVRCGEPVHLIIEADEPHLLNASSPRVQGTFDAARAMLEFECGAIPSAQVTGQLRGISRASYRVDTDPGAAWLLSAEAHASTPAPAPVAATPVASQFAVRTLTTGIGVDEAIRRVRREFRTEPRYDAAARELTVMTHSDCYDPRRTPLSPGAQCLTARFTDTAEPRLSRLFYTQAVDTDQSEAIRGQLIDTFGEPQVDRAVQRGDTPVLHLAWGDRVTTNRDGRTVERHPLVARIRASDDVTLVRLNLVEPDLEVADSRIDDEPAHYAQF